MSSPIQSAAVLGLGIIGSRALARLDEAGWQVACWNRTPKGLPGEVPTPEEAARGSAVISIYLKDRAAVREVMERVFPHLTEGQIVLNHATVDLETTQWLAERCAARGCRFLDTPLHRQQKTLPQAVSSFTTPVETPCWRKRWSLT